MNAPLYTTEILRLAASLRGPRDLDRVDGQADLRSPTCGSRISLEVRIDEHRRVQAISQQVQACAFGQASAALLEARAIGLNHSEASETLILFSRWLSKETDEVPGWPEITALSPARNRQARHGAILLPFRTFLAALDSCR